MKEYLVSVIIPVYNAEKWICRCLDSILNGTYNNLEILCIDDGSRDSSLEMLYSIARQDSRVVVLSQENRGVSAARNYGLSKARGEYCAFVDVDDWVDKDYFRLLVSEIKDYDIINCRHYVINSYSVKDDMCSSKATIISKEQAFSDHDYKSYVWGKLFRSNKIRKLSFREELRMEEDKLFCMQAISASEKIAQIEKKLYYYYSHSESSMQKEGANIYPAAVAMLEIADREKNIFFLRGAYAGFLAHRYANLFSTNYRIERKKCANKLMECAMLSLKVFPFKEILQWNTLALFSSLYRFWRIHNDRTLLLWEKRQKEMMKKN